MSVYAAPDATMGPLPDQAGPTPGMAGPPGPGDPASMAMLAAALGAGGPGAGGPPPGMGGPDLGAPSDLGVPPDTGGGGPGGADALQAMSATDHIRAAIKHLMMAMTESGDDEESHGITKGMSALHQILASKAKSQRTISAAGG
jgi:hypothetical protein